MWLMEEGKQEEKKGIPLAESLFGRAFHKKAAEHLNAAKADLARGALEQAGEHQRRAGPMVAHAITHLTSERLTEEENAEWLRLQERKYFINPSGRIITNKLDDLEEERLSVLIKKASGK